MLVMMFSGSNEISVSSAGGRRRGGEWGTARTPRGCLEPPARLGCPPLGAGNPAAGTAGAGGKPGRLRRYKTQISGRSWPRDRREDSEKQILGGREGTVPLRLLSQLCRGTGNALPSSGPCAPRFGGAPPARTRLVVVERPGTQPLPRQVRRLLVLGRVVVLGPISVVLREGEKGINDAVPR